VSLSQATVQALDAPVIRSSGLTHTWRGGRSLRFPAIELAAGETLFVHGPSGSGKSTLLGLLAGVLVSDQGSLNVLGVSLSDARQAERDRLRADHVGYIFQQFNLLPYLDVAANVALACRFSAPRLATATTHGSLDAEVNRLLEALALAPGELRERRAGELSVGQQQRVAAARALIGGPRLLIADEPTSALDSDTRAAFIELMLAECTRHRTSVVFVSHDLSLASHFDRTLRIAA
jgi:putative ABC transport system ATP-binding protein